MQSFNAVEKHSSCPSHQQELSSAFSLTESCETSHLGTISTSSLYPSHSRTHTQTNEHMYPHKHILSILNECDTEFFSGHPHLLTTHVHSVSCFYPFAKLYVPPTIPPTSSLSRLDVVERVKAARLRRSTSHAQPGLQRVLGGRVQRVVLRERQHHCISLQEKGQL